jgi:hypothetical protein
MTHYPSYAAQAVLMLVTKCNGNFLYSPYDGKLGPKENLMKRWLLVPSIAVCALLAGCATPTIRSNVTVFQDWPADLQRQPFVFERSKEQDNNLEYRTYESLVRNELMRLGFMEATTTQSPRLKVSMRYGMNARDIRVVQPVVVDPLWYGPPPFFYGPRWRGYYGPYYDPFWYGPPMTEYRDISYTLYSRQLKVAISRTPDSRKLYDVTVESEGRNGALAEVMPYMVRSAFAEFPGKNGETRRVELKMQD